MNANVNLFPSTWNSLTIAIIGGDEREQEIARLAAETGARVKTYGFPYPDTPIEGVTYAHGAGNAIEGANVVLFPIPGMGTDGSIFATEKIVPGEALLSRMAEGGHIFLGIADAGLRNAANKLGIALHEYEHDKELMLLRAPAIVEGAIKVMIENTDITLHKSQICVCGLGNIGSVLARTLTQLGAEVTVAARNPVQRAMAYTFASDSIDIADLSAAANKFDVLVSTIPAPIIDRTLLDRLRSDCVVFDLTAPPGSVDFGYAEKLGIKAVWARALGRRARVTVGKSQWVGVSKSIAQLMNQSCA